jgi:hypothetical protein
MSYIDDIIKWFKSPKTIKGLAGMTIIIIILAVDFAWWAGQEFAATASGASDDDVVEEAPWYYKDDLDDSHSGTLPLPSRGQIYSPGVTVDYIDFEVAENTTLGFFNLTASGTALRPDFDLRIYGPDGDTVGESATEAADESLKFEFKVFNRTGPGTWTVEVDNYKGSNNGYTLTIQTYVRAPIEESEEER